MMVRCAHLFQGLFQAGDGMFQQQRLGEAGTHHLRFGVATHLLVWGQKRINK